jgi:5-formyltetrahydrofolate cyclo-ligase
LDVKTAKRLLRKEVWIKLESEHISKFPSPCFGRIPNFVGSERAALRVRLLAEWQNTRVVFANPDFAQQKVREYVLLDGKILIMASPRLKHGYVLVEPKDARGSEKSASTIGGAFKSWKVVNITEVPKPDLIVEGSVAVDMQGHRLGKGHGYADGEIRTVKRVFGEIPVATTVHDVQVVGVVPHEEKDEKISVIVTPTRVIRIKADQALKENSSNFP